MAQEQGTYRSNTKRIDQITIKLEKACKDSAAANKKDVVHLPVLYTVIISEGENEENEATKSTRSPHNVIDVDDDMEAIVASAVERSENIGKIAALVTS